MKKALSLILIAFFLFVKGNFLYSQQGTSCNQPYYLYPAADCNNVNGTEYLGRKQCPRGDCGAFTMAGTTTIDGSCPDNDIAQTVAWLAVTASTTSFTINNNRTGSNGTPVGNAMDYVVFSGTCGSLTEIGCYIVNGMGGSQVVAGLTTGEVYYILMSRSGGSLTNPYGSACITSTIPYVPSGNTCASAQDIVTNQTNTYTNAGGSPNGPMCPGIGVQNVAWFKWCSPPDWIDGQSAYVNLNNQYCNSSSGLQLTVWNTNNTCPTSSANPIVVCAVPDQNKKDYYFEWVAYSNTCYYIAVDGTGGTACNFDLTVGSINPGCTIPDPPITQDTTVCLGNGVILVPTFSSNKLHWFDAPNAGNLLSISSTFEVPSVNASVTYYVQAVDGLCKSARVPVTINLLGKPTVEAGIDTIITCSNLQVNLNGAGSSSGAVYSYNWNTSAGSIVSGSTTLTPLIEAAGKYFLTVTNVNYNCFSVDSVSVSIDTTSPSVNVNIADFLTCNKTSVYIDGIGSSVGSQFVYSWNTLDGNIISGSNDVNPLVGSEGTYILNVSNTENGCTNSKSLYLPPAPDTLLAVAFLPQQINCSNSIDSLSGFGSSIGTHVIYLWSSLDGNIVSGDSTLYPLINASGTYELNVIDSVTGCMAGSSIIVLMDTIKPIVSIAAPEIISCKNTTVEIDGSLSSSGQVYSWSTINGNILSNSNGLKPIVNLAGEYTFTILSANGCSSTSTITVGIDTLKPNAIINSPDPITCSITTISLEAYSSSVGPNYSYIWNTNDGNIISGATGLSPLINLQGTYLLTVYDSLNGCVNSSSIYVNAPPDTLSAAIANPQLITCSNTSVLLDGFLSSSGDNIIYSWTTGNGNIVSGSNSLFPTVNSPGIYSLLVTDSETGCFSNASITVLIDTISPIASIVSPALLTCSNPSIILNGEASSPNQTYSWSTPTGNIVSGNNTLSPTVNSEGIYTLIVTSANGCKSESYATVIQNIEYPSMNAGNDLIICKGGESVPLVLADDGMEYKWIPALGVSNSTIKNPSLGPSETTTYVLLVTNPINGCSSSDSLIVNVININAEIVSSNLVLNSELMMNFIGATSGGQDYFWAFGDGFTSNGLNVTHDYLSSGSYQVIFTVSDTNGCFSSDSIKIELTGISSIQAPNVFTPNNDSKNDLFSLQNKNIKEFDITIFNRWGQVIFDSNDLSISWDGMLISGVPANEGVYFYTINALGEDNKEFKLNGSLTLIR